MITQGLRQKVDVARLRITPPPHQPNPPPDSRRHRPHRDLAGAGFAARHRRQQRAAQPGGDHLQDGFQAGGAEIAIGIVGGGAADGQGLVAQAIAFGEQQQALAAEIGLGHDFARRGFGGFGFREPEGFIEEGEGFEAVVGDGEGHEGGIEPVGGEAFEEGGGHVLAHLEAEIGVGFLQGGDEPGQEVGAEGWDEAEAEGAGQRARGGLADALDGFDIGEDLAGAAGDFGADGGGADGFGGAFEEGDAELGFEVLDLRAEGGLGDVAGGGGAAEMAVFGEGDDVAEVLEGQICRRVFLKNDGGFGGNGTFPPILAFMIIPAPFAQ